MCVCACRWVLYALGVWVGGCALKCVSGVCCEFMHVGAARVCGVRVYVCICQCVCVCVCVVGVVVVVCVCVCMCVCS